MGAREKLNAAYFHGSLLLAALAGGLAQSWLIFLGALAAFLVGNLYLQEIRPKRQDRHQGKR